MNLESYIRDIPDYPKAGILFKDITPLIKDPDALKESVKLIADYAKSLDVSIIAGIESRGFIFGTAVAVELGVGFIPIRKPGKLPSETISESYTLEYGSNTLEMHTDALTEGDRVLIVDDLLATGGTMQAAVKLVERSGAEITGIAFVIELVFLNGRGLLDGYNMKSLISY